MVYSLVNAPALGFDLVRLRQGGEVAHVLLTALRADTDDLHRLAAEHRARTLTWAELRAAEPQDRVPTTLDLAGEALELALHGEQSAVTAVVWRLEHAPLGNLDALAHLLRHEILAWTWKHEGAALTQDDVDDRAAEVLLNAAASAYCAARLPDPVRRDLAAPYLRARTRPDHDPDDTGAPDDRLATLLGALGTNTAAGRQAWRDAVDLLRPHSASWAPAMHEATWAIHLSGRVALAAAAQLRGVLAFRRAGFTGRDGAHGVWNAISGILQASVVDDLLGEDDLATLHRPWVLARGDEPGAFLSSPPRGPDNRGADG